MDTIALEKSFNFFINSKNATISGLVAVTIIIGLGS
jgi:hypothetical protein